MLFRSLSGRSVNIKGLGYFFLSAQSKGTEKAEDFTIANISGLRVCFRANSDIRLFTGTTTRSDGLKFKDLDHINDLGSVGDGSDDGGLTGESLPVDVSVGSEILSGSLNGSGVLEVKVTKLFSEAFFPTGMLKTIRIFTEQLFYLKGFTLTVTFSVLLAWL